MKTAGVIMGGLILPATAGGVYLWRRRRKLAVEAERAAEDLGVKVVADLKTATRGITRGIDARAQKFLRRNLPQIQDLFRDALDRSKAATMTAVPAVERGAQPSAYGAPNINNVSVFKVSAVPAPTNETPACRALRLELRRVPTGVARDIAEYRMNILGC